MKRNVQISLLVALFLCGCACDASVNRSQYLRDNERSGGMTSVNGSIHVGATCTIDGDCNTVNGRIMVGDGSHVRDLDTVNGRIAIGKGVEVDGDATTVNGSIVCGAGSKISGKVTTVNGRIELRNTVVDDEVTTVNGDILLAEKSVVRGDIVIKGRHGNFFDHHQHLEIRISGGSIVEGGIDVRDKDVEVTVYLDKDAVVKGQVRNAEVVRE